MKNIITISLCALALSAPLSYLRGQSPAQPERGRVLILRESEKTLTGDIERDGDEYRVKRLVGETRIPAASVLTLCATLEDAHQYMQKRANLDDPDERIRLAEWCRQHNLRAQAIEESKAALALKPNHPRARHLLNYLEHAKTQSEQSRPVVPERPAPRVDVTAESMGMFSSKVHPILMNACVNCHNSSGRGGSFQLTRTSGGLTNRRSLEQNLAAVIAEINSPDPSSSRLLLKSITIHAAGMTQAPLKNRQSPAFRTLEAWVKLTLETNPQLKEQVLAAAAPTAPPNRVSDDRPVSRPEAPPRSSSTPPEAPPENDPPPDAPAKAAVAQEPPAKQPPAPKEPAGPVDPDAFNREFHPDRKPEGQ